MLAEAALNWNLIATLPLWPLVGAMLVGVMLMFKARPTRAAGEHGHGSGDAHGGHGDSHGHGTDKILTAAHWPVILGTAASAAIALLLFLGLYREHGDAAAETAVVKPHVAGAAEHAAITSEPAASGHAGEAGHAAAIPPGYTYTLFHWISLGEKSSKGGRWIDFNFYFDNLTAVMMIVVTIVGLLVVIYSSGYMRDHHGHAERGYERFFAFLGLFVFSMAMLVYAGNFVLLYLGWELVGLCSYLLIGFYYPKPSAAAAAKKAFLVNRIGDFGFALGIFALYMFLAPIVAANENPLDYVTVFKYASHLTENQATIVCLLLFCGAVGKSAQLPLYVWLPDAMEGPSPVSALIHAATMVTAGIYMVARCGPLYAMSPLALNVVTIVGAAGALFAATMAMAQYDMKRIMAYSTMSQLAYMFVALGCAAPDSGIFHLYTHAFFKALLFLSAGAVMHAMGNVIDLREFSGLRRVLPQTRIVMLIGCLALAGFPFLAGFWSKDEIVHAALNKNMALGVIMLATSALTAYYTFRMYFMCFHGPLRLPAAAGEHPHESGPAMMVPLWLLAIGAMFAGYAGVTLGAGGSFLGMFAPHGFFHHFIAGSSMVRGEQHAGGEWLMYASAGIAIVAIGIAWVRYGQAPQVDPDRKALGGLWFLWHAKYFVDEIYDALFVRPLRKLGDLCFGTDRFGIDGVIWFVAAVPRGLGFGLRFFQQGALQGYAMGMVVGLTVLMIIWRMADSVG